MIVRWERRRTPAYPIRLQLTQIRNISLQDGRNEAEASRSSALFLIAVSSDRLSIVDRCRQTSRDGRNPLVAPDRRWRAPRSDQSRRTRGGAKAVRPAPQPRRVWTQKSTDVNGSQWHETSGRRKTRARSDARDPGDKQAKALLLD